MQHYIQRGEGAPLVWNNHISSKICNRAKESGVCLSKSHSLYRIMLNLLSLYFSLCVCLLWNSRLAFLECRSLVVSTMYKIMMTTRLLDLQILCESASRQDLGAITVNVIETYLSKQLAMSCWCLTRDYSFIMFVNKADLCCIQKLVYLEQTFFLIRRNWW